MNQNELEEFGKIYLATYDAVKLAKDSGLQLEQMIRLVENMYQVVLKQLDVPRVFWRGVDSENSIIMLSREIKQREMEDQKLIEEKIEMEPIEDYFNNNI